MANPNKPSLYIRGASAFVPDLQYHSDVNTQGIARVKISAPATLDADGLLAAASINAAVTRASTWAATYTAAMQAESGGLAEYGRNVTVVASGAATSTVTVYGRDYLHQPMAETLTLNGTNAVLGLKAFKWIDSWSAGATSSTTIDLGWGSKLGLPLCADGLIAEQLDDAPTSNAGTFVGAVKTDPATATTGDTRGTYTPHSSNLPNGSRTYRLIIQCDKTKLHGVAQYYA